jgi:hypothetical protein
MRLRRVAMIVGLSLSSSPILAQSPAARPFIVATDAEPGTYVHHWSRLIYEEAFRRLGIPVKLATIGLARRSALVEGGEIDGAVARTRAYGDAHPELQRIDEPIMEFTFSLYAADASLRPATLEELPGAVVAEYRRGVLGCENSLGKVIAPDRLSNVAATEQGLRKLLARRSDVYCDIDVYVREALQADGFKQTPGVRKLFDIASVPTYPYIYRKHADLAPRLASVLRQMRVEGLLSAYPKQAERLAGWSR